MTQRTTDRFLAPAKLGLSSLLALAGSLTCSGPADAAAAFATQQTFATGTGPHVVAAADLNADGKIDLVVTNQSSTSVSVLINTTTGASPNFATQVPFTTGAGPVGVAITDINGDGKPDLVVTNSQNATISVLLNTTAAGAATPTFAAQQTFATGKYPFSVAAGDIDGDGKPDLAVANAGGSAITLLRNTTAAGATTATFATAQAIATGIQPAAVAFADFNNDGKVDLVVANFVSHTASVLLNTTAAGAATLSFAAQTVITTGTFPNSVAVADFNGDTLPDVVVVNSGDFNVSVALNATAAGAAAAAFGTPKTFATGISPASVATADVDGDGLPDLIVANQSGSTVSVLLNTTAKGAAVPTFAAQQTFATGLDSVGAASADVDGDGRPDLVVSNFTDKKLSVLLNSSSFAGVNLNQHGITGSWFNPATGGQGLEIELYPNLGAPGQGLLFGGWFTYDTSAGGGQRWYALSGGVSSTGPAAQLGIYAGLGGNFAAAPVIAPTRVGSATLHLSDCGNATLIYSFYDGRTGTIPLTRLTSNITCAAAGDNGSAASNYLLSGSWSDPNLGGQGLVFDVNPAQGNFFAAWYTYAPNGQTTGGAASERWYVIQAAFAPGTKTLLNAPIYSDGGGVFDNATAPVATQVGTATIAFSNCNTATLNYAFTAGANSGLSGTLNLTRTGPTPAGCSL